MKARLLRDGHADEAAIKAIDQDIRRIGAEAADFATHDPEPDASELWTDILH